MTPLNGWLVLDKPAGLGSTQGVAAVKRALRRCGLPKAKVGHGGTLDPFATGVLPVTIGEATKLAGRLLDATKAYRFTLRMGVETDTLDPEGAVVATSDARPDGDALRALLPRFTGAIVQTPPAYSALKVDGVRAYDRARAGEAVALAPRAVTVHALTLLEAAGDEATFDCTVSKGTYVRSLGRDIARAAGTVGHLTALRRTRAGPFALPQAIVLDILDGAATADALRGLCLPLEAGLDGIPALPLIPVQAELLGHGQPLDGIAVDDGLLLAKLGDRPVALVTAEAGRVSVVRGFNLPDTEGQ